jgi:hypothetical protein
MKIDRVSPAVAPAARLVDRPTVKVNRRSAKVGAPPWAKQWTAKVW